ncbi:2-amino-5-chloromuconate deaminase CnbZ [Variovorax saccharolyticus]|uniref:2-amino-5-chloromuconate deaminase CnbZ n=1 Tax=Variovorax saccharolyticus TaxID=3053516 RepID=UPI0025750B19|nr:MULTISPECIES: hypothetical protein [unclassified Variovorax]MDM0021682.1 hypothetical protein [Variovorax sp. J22R187]MDM0028063.1 hypothetical protein [Variovorax sp. J31P216]
MTQLLHFPAGQYRYLPGGFQYSAAVVADPGHVIERARFLRPVPLAEGFERIRAHLAALGRPPTALCACELRSPAPMDEAAFIAFNRAYVGPLGEWGLFEDDVNPVARCNLVPAFDAPRQAGFHAFSYTLPSASMRGAADFVTSGAAECPDRPGYRDNIVRLGESSPDALVDKLRFALGDLESRFALMGVGWADVADTRLYTVHDLHHAMQRELAERGALAGGLGWHWVRPPVQDLEIEVDARSVSREILLPA